MVTVARFILLGYHRLVILVRSTISSADSLRIIQMAKAVLAVNKNGLTPAQFGDLAEVPRYSLQAGLIYTMMMTYHYQ